MDLGINGRVAVVTGGARGIGAETARVLAAEGANLVVSDVDLAAAEVVAGEIQAQGGQAIAVRCDVANETEVKQMAAAGVEAFGSVDILVNNAGFNRDRYLTKMTEPEWDAVMDVVLKGAFHCSRAVLPGMMERNWGRIINIASVHGLVASKEKSAYVAAKHAVVGLTKTVALETARSGITCNAICPGWVLTPLVQQQIDKRIAEGVDPEQASAQLLAEKQPSGEFVTPQQLGEMALFLCSDAAAQVRGAAWNMDGGWVAQ